MHGGIKAALWLGFMAIIAFSGFFIYSKMSHDPQGIVVGVITGGMLLTLALLSLIRLKP